MEDEKKKKLFIEHLEKRHSTSPLLVQIRSVEELAMIEKFKKIMHVNPEGLDKNGLQRTSATGSDGVKKLSDDKFLRRIESKNEALSKTAADRSDLMGQISGRMKSQSDNKFVARIEGKQESLSRMAIRKEELMGSLHRAGENRGAARWIKGLLKQHSDVYDPYKQ